MTSQEYKETKLELEGWPVNVTSYKLGDRFYCKVDNVSPGAWLARTTGATREEAEQAALERARQMLGRTRRQAV
ncbi:MAG: hypothetical protein HYX72_02765 [Acidobacteria bacterium]|nr:hypothetical protein [Acidobacteriota bacterium]